MASRSTSPGGALLRASRIFAIPAPLPRPATQYSKTSRTSETATLPYPVNLTITTTQSSRARGDWGFKRPLPLRSTTKSSTPLIRVDAIDTYEQFTDYSSAADHTLTLKKFEEMGVPMSTPPRKAKTALGYGDVRRTQRSVFDDSIDSTTQEDGSDEARDKRWRFGGPWVAGLTEGDFSTYVTKQVRKRRTAFTAFLRERCAESLDKEAQRAARDQQEELVQTTTQASDVTDGQFKKYVMNLRNDRAELYKHIRKFLDLPPAPNSMMQGSSDWLSAIFDGDATTKTINSKDLQPASESPYADSGPPKTHPSAGLSYGISSARTFNHPLYGPQNKSPPVEARVVMPKLNATGNVTPVLGVGGFVVDVPLGASSVSYNQRTRGVEGGIPGLISVEPNKVGGSKTYVHPTSASVDTEGRIILKVEQGDPEAVSVLQGKVDEIPQREIMRTKGFSMGSRYTTAFRSLGSYGLDKPVAGVGEQK